MNLEQSELSIDEFSGLNYLHKDDNYTINRCCRCESIYINDDECETCGFQFDIDRLGRPLGEKSFFAMKEKYWNSRFVLTRSFPSLEKTSSVDASKYKREMVLRFKALVDFFAKEDKLIPVWSTFLYEYQSLVRELFLYGINKIYLRTIVDQLFVDYSSDIYKNLTHEIAENEKVLESFSNPIESFFNYKFFGILRVGVVFVSLLLFGIMSYGGIAYFKYLEAMR